VLDTMAEPFNVDLANPDEIQSKMPEIKQLYAERREALKALENQVELLRRLVGEKPPSAATASGASRARAKKAARPKRAGINAPSQDRAVKGLEHAGRPMGPTTLYRYMVANNLDVPKDANALGSNLWSAWRAGRIMKATNGVYQPLDGSGETTVDGPLTDYDFAAEQGFPVPAQLPHSNSGGSQAG
jgi:hypothetical protein